MSARPENDTSGTAPSIVGLSDLSFSWAGSSSFSLSIEQFCVRSGETVLLTGPSGSGKSTLLSLLCGVITPRQGRVEVLGTDITQLASAARDRFRVEHFGIIFQMFNLLPYGSVLDNVLLPLSFAAERRSRAGANGSAKEEAVRLLQRLGLDRQVVDGRSAARLSVGQQQRVAAARALIGTPEIVVADEPTSALDRDRQADFLGLLFDQIAEARSTLIMVSHDETLASRFDRTVPLSEFIGPASGPQL
ncbi:MAG: ABC transporter ATP-binding protein [Methyloligellaceae bacterium]